MKSKNNCNHRVPGTRFKVVETMIPSLSDHYRVYRENSANSRDLLAMFRYKVHAEHFKSYLEMGFQ
jgi:hypothetical protein